MSSLADFPGVGLPYLYNSFLWRKLQKPPVLHMSFYSTASLYLHQEETLLICNALLLAVEFVGCGVAIVMLP